MSRLITDEIAPTTGKTLKMPVGSILQMAGDTWTPGSVTDVATTAPTGGPYGNNLEVDITFRSTSNKFFVQVHIPDGYNNGVAGRTMHGGFQYSVNNFTTAGTALGPQQIITDYIGYTGSSTNDLFIINYHTWGSVPVTGAVKIRPYLIAVNGAYRTNANSLGVYSLSVMEIQG